MSDNISNFPTNDDAIIDADFTEVTDEVTEETTEEVVADTSAVDPAEAAPDEFRSEVPRIPIPVFNIKVDVKDWKAVENTPHFVATFAINGVKKGAKTYIIPNDAAIVDAANNKRIGTMLRNDIYQNKFVFGIMEDAVSLMYTGDIEITEHLYFTIAQEAPEAPPEFAEDPAEEIAEEAVAAEETAVEAVDEAPVCECEGDCEECMCGDSEDGTTAPSESTIKVQGLEDYDATCVPDTTLVNETIDEDSDADEGPIEEITPE